MLKKLTLAAAAAGALALGSLSLSTSGQAAVAGVFAGQSAAVQSNVVEARWRRHHRRHCWWHHGRRHCRW